MAEQQQGHVTTAIWLDYVGRRDPFYRDHNSDLVPALRRLWQDGDAEAGLILESMQNSLH